MITTPRAIAQRERSRAYTLVEVLVAMSMGVLVSLAAFTLSKNATQFFQHEARVSSAQLALTLAMNRLTNDIQRASYLSSPNALNDPRVCRDELPTWPNGLRSLAGINITASTQSTPQIAQNYATPPDALIIGGSMDTSEVFQVQSIIPGNSGAPLLILRAPANEPATMRVKASLGSTETLTSRMTPVFFPNGVGVPSGRFAHIYHPEGDWHWFGTIDSFVVDANGALNIQLGSVPAIPSKPGSNCGLGIGDMGGGWLFSVVSRVRYDIRNLGSLPNTNPYSAVTSPVSPAVTGDAGRTELVRVELDPTGNEIQSTLEVIAEYAVDMRFGLTVSSMATASNYNPTVTSYPFGNGNIYTIAKDPNLGGSPQLIRAVQVRLSTRTRAPDRDADLPVGPDGRRLHFLVDPTLQQKYARVRTNYANVALPNQGGFSLW